MRLKFLLMNKQQLVLLDADMIVSCCSVLSEQTEALRKRKIDQLSQKIDIIIAGKRQKLLSKGVTGKYACFSII